MNEHSHTFRTMMIQRAFICINFILLFTSCRFFNNRSDLKLHPDSNTIYQYSLVKTFITKWKYIDTHIVYDTVSINFSMQKIAEVDTAITFRISFNKFVWRGGVHYSGDSSRAKTINVIMKDSADIKQVSNNNETVGVHYVRDSLHAKLINVIMSDSGNVKQVSNTNELLQDISNDVSTQNYMRGVIQDYFSVNGVEDIFAQIFALLPVKKVNEKDIWGRNIILIAKAPVSVSNLYTLQYLNDDTATINIQSFISARQSYGDVTFLKGNQEGYTKLSYSTGMPFHFETLSGTVTATKYYEVTDSICTVVNLESQYVISPRASSSH